MIQSISKPKYFLIILLSAIWLHLDSHVYTVFGSLEKNYYLSIYDLRLFLMSLFSILRLFIPYIIFLIFSFYFYNYLSLKTNNKHLNIVIGLLVINFAIQSISLLVYQENVFNNFSLIFLTLMSLTLFTVQYNQNYSQKTFIISLLLLFAILLWFGSIMAIWYFTEYNETANLYGGWPDQFIIIKDLNQNIPRSSGIARSSLVLLIPLSLSFLAKKIKFYKLRYCIYLYLFFLIGTTQSRIILFSLFLFEITMIIYIVSFNKKLLDIFKKIITICVIPLIFYIGTVTIKINLLKKSKYLPNIVQTIHKGSLTSDENLKTEDKILKIIRTVDSSSFTSSRYQDWQKILEKNTNIIFGNGIMGDRWIIKQSASNLLLYNYTSSGIIGLILFILVMTRSLFINFIILFFREKKVNSKNYILLSASYIQFALMGRSLVETSFAVYGIDFLIFFSAYFFTEHYYINQKLKK